jgi:hypothetical protein
MNLRWLGLAALAVLSAHLNGQTLVRFDGNATQTASNVPAGAAANVMTVPYANVTVCAYPAVGSPCTNTVQVYSDQAGAQPISYPLQTDGKGRFGFWVSPGTYSYSVVSGKGVTIGDSPFTVGGGGGGGAPPAGSDTEVQSRANSSTFGRTGVFVDNATTPTLVNTKIPQGLYTYNSAKTNSQFGGIDAYHRFQLCSQDAILPGNGVGTSACNQEWSTFYSPGINLGGTDTNGNAGWSVTKLHERYMLVQTPGISQTASTAHYAFKTGDASNGYDYLINFGGWEDNGGEGQYTRTLQSINNNNMYQAVAQTTETGPHTFVPAAGWKDYALVGGYIIDHDRPLVSGNIIAESEYSIPPFSLGAILTASAAVFTPSSFQGTNPSGIDIGAPNAGVGVVRTFTLTGSGTPTTTQVMTLGCADYPVIFTPTTITGGGGTWQITATLYKGCASGAKAWQGGTHGLMTLPWVDKVIHEAANAGMWQSGWLIGGASDSTHIYLYQYQGGRSQGHLQNWGQDWGHSYTVGLTRTSNLAQICASGEFASQPITVTGATDASFNGAFTAGPLNNATGCFTWSNPGPDVSSPVTAQFNVGGTVGGANGRGAFTIYPYAMVKQAIPTPTVTNGTTSLAFSGSLALFDNDLPIVAGDHIIAMQSMANKSGTLGQLAYYWTPPTSGRNDGSVQSVSGPGVQTLLFSGRRLENYEPSVTYANGGGTGHQQGATADYIRGPWARTHYEQAPLPGGIGQEIDVSDATFFGVHGDYIDRVHRMHGGNYGYTTRFDPWIVKYTTLLSNADTGGASTFTQDGDGYGFFSKWYQLYITGHNQSGEIHSVTADAAGHLDTSTRYWYLQTAAGCAIGGAAIGATCTKAITITGIYPGYADINYVATGCTVEDPTGGPATIGNVHRDSPAQFTVTMVALSASSTGGGTINCQTSHN